MRKLLIIGAGGFGQMIKETATELGYEEVVFLDDAVKGTDVIGKCCDYQAFLSEYDTAVAELEITAYVFIGQRNLLKQDIMYLQLFIPQQ